MYGFGFATVGGTFFFSFHHRKIGTDGTDNFVILRSAPGAADGPGPDLRPWSCVENFFCDDRKLRGSAETAESDFLLFI